MLTILSVGEDLSLLRTRAEVLRRTGANVLSSSGAAASRFIARWEFDLVVLCHSVGEQDGARIADAARQRSVKTKVLLLASDEVPMLKSADAVFDATVIVEPVSLIRHVMELLNTEKGSSQEVPGSVQAKADPGRKKPANYPAEIAARKALVAHFERRRAS